MKFVAKLDATAFFYAIVVLALFVFFFPTSKVFATTTLYAQTFEEGFESDIITQGFNSPASPTNFSEAMGVRFDFIFNDIEWIGIAMCEDGINDYIGYILDENRNIIATSTETDVKPCPTDFLAIATSTDPTNDYSYFRFATTSMESGYRFVVQRTTTSGAVNRGFLWQIATTSPPYFIFSAHCFANHSQCSGSLESANKPLFTTYPPGSVIDENPEDCPACDPIGEYIQIISPEFGTTTASTTVDIEIKFQTPQPFEDRPPTRRRYHIEDANTHVLEYVYTFDVPAGTGDLATVTQSIVLSEGSKNIFAAYYVNDPNSPFDGYVYGEQVSSFFHVATNTYIGFTGLLNPQDNPLNLSQINCDLFDIGCQFQKALVFLLVPRPDTLAKFSNLWINIQTKRPFGYIVVTINQLKTLNANTAQAFSLGTIPFTDTIFDPFKTLLAGILWALFGIYWYHHRLKHIEL